jgi:hypothetical protein
MEENNGFDLNFFFGADVGAGAAENPFRAVVNGDLAATHHFDVNFSWRMAAWA